MVGIFPVRDALICLVGAVLAEQHNEWIESLRYLGLHLIQQSLAVGTEPKKETNAGLALSA